MRVPYANYFFQRQGARVAIARCKIMDRGSIRTNGLLDVFGPCSILIAHFN